MPAKPAHRVVRYPTAAHAFPVLVGDIGGTHCRLSLSCATGSEIALSHFKSYACAEFPTAEDALDHYLASIGESGKLHTAVIAVAGPVVAGAVQSTNMPWSLSEDGLLTRGLYAARLINDYTALALSVPHLKSTDLLNIGPALTGAVEESIAVIGAGTGLGVSAVTRGLGGAATLATEGGHVSFAPQDEFEVEIWRIMQGWFGRVSAERVLSGPGLMNLYRAMCQLEGRACDIATAEEIGAKADAGDEDCRRALDRFCGIYGAFAGDVALLYGARRGVYLGGGIAPAIAPYIQDGTFRARFEDKGRFRDYLARIPTKIITRHDAALMGSASLAHALIRAEMT